MGAYIVTPTKEQWEVISDFLGECGEGALVIPPDVMEELKSQGKSVDDIPSILNDYDFGGDPDKWIDVIWESTDHRLEEVFPEEDTENAEEDDE